MLHEKGPADNSFNNPVECIKSQEMFADLGGVPHFDVLVKERSVSEYLAEQM